MNATGISVPIQYEAVVHHVQTTRSSTPLVADVTRRGPRPLCTDRPVQDVCECTLLELVQAVGEVTADDREVVAVVIHLLESGQVRLCGNFRDEPVDLILAS